MLKKLSSSINVADSSSFFSSICPVLMLQIPLAKKLSDCGVFGVSSYEYLSYAQQNRKEWEKRGEEVVAEMVANARRKNVGDIVFEMQQDCIDHEGKTFVQEVLDATRRRASCYASIPTAPDLPLEITTEHKKEESIPNTEDLNHDLDSDDDLNSFDHGDESMSQGSDFQVPIKG